MNLTDVGSARAEWKAHWKVVIAATVGMSLAAIPAYGLGLFIHPLEEEYGWSRTGISLALTIYSLTGMLLSPLAGALVDRLGSRRIGLTGVLVFCLMIALLSQVTQDIRTWWAMWVAIGLAGLLIKTTVWSKAVTSFFTRARGTALAIMASGTGLCTIVLPWIAHPLIQDFGWREAFIGVGLAFAAVIAPVVYFWFCDASDKPAAANDARSKADRLRAMPGWSVHEGLRRRQTWQLAFAALLITGIVTGYSVHIVAMLTSHGIPRGQSVALLGLVGLLSMLSRLTVGAIFDRVGSPLVGLISVGVPIVPALVLLLVEPSMGMALAAVITLGISIGAEYDALIYLSTRYFGLKAFGVLFGIVGSSMLAGVALGPLLAGYIFDQTRSYDHYYLLTVPVVLAGATLIGLLGRYPDHQAEAALVPAR